MKSFGIFIVAIIGSALASPWKRQASSQASNNGSNWPRVNFRQRFSIEFSNLRKFYTHLIKSSINADTLTTYFQLPAAERQCIENFYYNLKEYNQTDEEVLSQLKTACPNPADAIQVLHDKFKAIIGPIVQKITDFFNNLPQSIKNADNKVSDAFKTLIADNQLLNQTALKEVFVPALQSLYQIPEADLQTLANNNPILAPIATGNRRQAVGTLIQAEIDLINTGKVSNQSQVDEALRQFGEFLGDVFKQPLAGVDQATEASLPQDADQALDHFVDQQLAKYFGLFKSVPFLKVNIDTKNDVYEIFF
uniref:Uncharacterized protein n=1 Tax=Acrobeloides nanus TaxID=290746 RepID=A0A914DJN2_9BILA